MTFDEYVAPSFLQLDGAKERCIEFFSHSKTYNMTGWRVGFAAGGAEPIKALSIIKNNIDSGIFKAIQRAGVRALESPKKQLDSLNLMYQKRRDIMVQGLKELGWDIKPSKATFYLWLPTPNNMGSVEFAALMLEKANIIVPPGNGYGPGGEGFFRIALTVSEERLKEALQRMKNAGIRYNG
jgi:LL-diaminopimelate aminotransferase